jgi:multiple sugar transport system substrate-binding protein
MIGHMSQNGGKYILKVSAIAMILLIAAGVIFMLAGQGPDQTGKQAGKLVESGGKEKGRITFAFRKNGTGNDMEDSIKKYNEIKDSTDVEIVKIPDDKYDETLNMYFTSGGAPDVFEIGSEWLDIYVAKDWISDLQNYCSEDFLMRFPDWVDRYMHEKYTGTGIYSLPASQMTIRLIYNKDLFRMVGLDPNSPPKTMDEVKSYAERISKIEIGNKKYGFALNVGDGRKCFEQYMEGANTYNGINYYNLKEGRYDLNVYGKWLKSIREMRENESLFPGETILKSNNILTQFAQGNIGMMYINSASLKILENLFGQLETQFDWDVALPPALDGNTAGKGKVSIIPSTFYCVKSTSSDMNASVAFWKYLYSYEHMEEMYRRGNGIPIIESIYKDALYVSPLLNMNKFIPGVNDSVYPVPPRTINDWLRIDSYIEAIEGSKTVEQVLANETDDLNYQFNLVIDGGQADSNVYRYPEFDWLDPLKR